MSFVNVARVRQQDARTLKTGRPDDESNRRARVSNLSLGSSRPCPRGFDTALVIAGTPAEM
jgi:hypothetical protein